MLEFVNVKTNERVKLTRPHQIGAYINSSDLHINASKGQDFGWRLAPEIVVKIDEMAADPQLLDSISRRIGVSVDEITTTHLAQYLSSQDDLEQRALEARRAREPEFKKEYEAKIAELKRAKVGTYIDEATTIDPELLDKVVVPKVVPAKKK